MTDHTRIRLETLDGTQTLAYFAPNAETTRSFDNDLFTSAIPDREDSAIALDYGSWIAEITLQGFFEQTDALPGPHETDVLDILDIPRDEGPATAKDQLNHLISRAVFGADGVEPPYALYDDGDEYTAETNEDVDVANGVYPAVFIEQIQPSFNSGQTREAYTIKFVPGVEQ